MDPSWFLILSDLFINLAAGWLGVVLIVPITSKKSRKIKLVVLTTNMLFAIFSLVAAYELKKLGG